MRNGTNIPKRIKIGTWVRVFINDMVGSPAGDVDEAEIATGEFRGPWAGKKISKGRQCVVIGRTQFSDDTVAGYDIIPVANVDKILISEEQ